MTSVTRYYVGYDIDRHRLNHPRPITFRNSPYIFRNSPSNRSLVQAKTGFLVIKNVTFWVDYKSIEAAKKNKPGYNPIFAYAVGEVIGHGELEKIGKWKLPNDLLDINSPILNKKNTNYAITHLNI